MIASSHSWKRARATAEHFGIGISTLWLWSKTREGFTPPLRASPGVTLFDVAAIEAFLLDQSAKTAA